MLLSTNIFVITDFLLSYPAPAFHQLCQKYVRYLGTCWLCHESVTYTVSWPQLARNAQANCHIILSEDIHSNTFIWTAAWNCCSHIVANKSVWRCVWVCPRAPFKTEEPEKDESMRLSINYYEMWYCVITLCSIRLVVPLVWTFHVHCLVVKQLSLSPKPHLIKREMPWSAIRYHMYQATSANVLHRELYIFYGNKSRI